MGTGDWNDGMNLVGAGGQGRERLARLVPAVAPAGRSPTSPSRAAKRDRADRYRASRRRRSTGALEEAWDGDWYRRAYFDDGTPLGSKENAECRIDAIAQSWAVHRRRRRSGARAAGDGSRSTSTWCATRTGLDPAADAAVRQDEAEPGLHPGLRAGVRENGGQYTHAALWTVLAFARAGRRRSRGGALLAAQPGQPRARRATRSQRYRAEPYVVAADVYSQPPHTGRGGWTWYTGSAGWMYRVGVEAILGLQAPRRRLHIDPCIPKDVAALRDDLQVRPRRVSASSSRIRRRESRRAPGSKSTASTHRPQNIPIREDGVVHQVRVVLG